MNEFQRWSSADHIIEQLKEVNVDGEMMQYIIEQLGLSEQMLKQLYLNAPVNERLTDEP